MTESIENGITVEQRNGARILRIDRPEARNALDSKALAAIVTCAEQARADASVRVLIVTGSDKVFVAGGDLKEFAALKGKAGGRTVARKGRAMIEALRNVGVPLVAAIDGDAYGGGCELAASCDLRIARAGTRLHWVQNALAVTTGWGATERLLTLVGAGTAARWLLGAQSVTAEEAHSAGFVDMVVTEGSALEAAVQWSESVSKIAAEITDAQLKLLRGVHQGQRSKSLAAELSAFAQCWAHPEHEEAVARFLASRARPR